MLFEIFNDMPQETVVYDIIPKIQKVFCVSQIVKNDFEEEEITPTEDKFHFFFLTPSAHLHARKNKRPN